jgi:Tfp pilus assembly protein PilN
MAGPAQQSAPIKNLLKTNLLVRSSDRLKLHVRLIKWLLSSGRYIVIIVEMIVIGAFVYRYKLDADLVSLQEEIAQQSAYVQSLKRDEDLIRLTQFQLSSIRAAKSADLNVAGFMGRIAFLTPKNVRLTTLSVSNGGGKLTEKSNFNLVGNTSSNSEVTIFLKSLQQDPMFEDVTLANISFEGSTVFTITGALKGKGASI